MKSVCIIGAGPAGLVTAKTFLEKGGYVVTIFEAANRVGGMWRAQPGEYGDKCSPEMRTNLSRFTVAFSDLSWSSVDLSDPVTGSPSPTKPPMFPKAWQVGRYLERYAQKFNLNTNITHNKRITSAKASSNFSQWEVTCVDCLTEQPSTHEFDHLILASGFFGQPINSFDPSPGGQSTNVIHSSKFRDISSLTEKAGKIAVIGGGISGSEAAAQAAFQISSAKYSPGKTKSIHSHSTVYHIINRPFYCLPRYLPQEVYLSHQNPNLAPNFLPLDLMLYNLSRRGDGEISAAITTVPPDKAKKGHEFMRSVIGGDQRDIGRPELVYTPDQTQYPGYSGITDTYTEFVRSGIIIPVRGWVEEVKENDDGGFAVTVTPKEPWFQQGNKDAIESTIIASVTGIIEATGYKTNLDFLDENVKRLLDYDPSCPRVPLLLSRGSVFARKIPTLAFIGFYEGPYWNVMEMQARLIADTWSKVSSASTPASKEYFHEQTDAEQMRCAMKKRSLQVSQFWMMDYVGLIEEFTRLTGVHRSDSAFGAQKGPAFASRYTNNVTDDDTANVVKEVVDILQSSLVDARFVAAAVFRGLQGAWTINRRIATRNFASPGGTFSGIAHFHLRTPTDPSYAAEYLYIEEGIFKMDPGASFLASRRYVYRYNETTEEISAWFADEDGETAGTLFNTWDFYHPSREQLEGGWRAKGHHWCDPDTYKNDCEFRFRGAALQTFGITYQVIGPKKDYSHESWYERAVVEYK